MPADSKGSLFHFPPLPSSRSFRPPPPYATRPPPTSRDPETKADGPDRQRRAGKQRLERKKPRLGAAGTGERSSLVERTSSVQGRGRDGESVSFAFWVSRRLKVPKTRCADRLDCQQTLCKSLERRKASGGPVIVRPASSDRPLRIARTGSNAGHPSQTTARSPKMALSANATDEEVAATILGITNGANGAGSLSSFVVSDPTSAPAADASVQPDVPVATQAESEALARDVVESYGPVFDALDPALYTAAAAAISGEGASTSQIRTPPARGRGRGRGAKAGGRRSVPQSQVRLPWCRRPAIPDPSTSRLRMATLREHPTSTPSTRAAKG